MLLLNLEHILLEFTTCFKFISCITHTPRRPTQGSFNRRCELSSTWKLVAASNAPLGQQHNIAQKNVPRMADAHTHTYTHARTSRRPFDCTPHTRLLHFKVNALCCVTWPSPPFPCFFRLSSPFQTVRQTKCSRGE